MTPVGSWVFRFLPLGVFRGTPVSTTRVLNQVGSVQDDGPDVRELRGDWVGGVRGSFPVPRSLSPVHMTSLPCLPTTLLGSRSDHVCGGHVVVVLTLMVVGTVSVDLGVSGSTPGHRTVEGEDLEGQPNTGPRR